MEQCLEMLKEFNAGWIKMRELLRTYTSDGIDEITNGSPKVIIRSRSGDRNCVVGHPANGLSDGAKKTDRQS